MRASLPAGVLFPVTIGVLGAMGPLGVARLPNDLYAQPGSDGLSRPSPPASPPRTGPR
jgi:hypothetical protein